MAQVEQDILNAGAQIIWVLEQTAAFQPGTATDCRTFVRSQGSRAGICVGDGQTQPTAGVWDRSPFARGRGIDMIVRRSDMHVVWVSTHGTPAGNENLTGAEVLAEVRRITGR